MCQERIEGSHEEHSRGLEKKQQKRDNVTCWCIFAGGRKEGGMDGM